jgi:hypothetical protein
MALRFLTILTGRNLPKIGPPTFPYPRPAAGHRNEQ